MFRDTMVSLYWYICLEMSCFCMAGNTCALCDLRVGEWIPNIWRQ